jgi:hypothetical protein
MGVIELEPWNGKILHSCWEAECGEAEGKVAGKQTEEARRDSG